MDKKALIFRPVETDLIAFNKAFSLSLENNSAKMQAVVDYVLQANGKRIRPVVVLLSALLADKVTTVSIESAVLIELLHTASLLHDDVVDETERRRGIPSVNAVFDNKVAVLAGDFILSVSLYKAIGIGNLKILSVFGQLGKYLSLGELNQLTNVQELNISEESYLKVIREKTAMLFAACTEIGALSANASDDKVAALRNYGEYIGMCFQIRDDIFDYYDNAGIGKPTGNDIREGKVTLPLLYAITQAKEAQKTGIISILQRGNFTEADIKYLIDFAKANGGIEYAQKKMQFYAGLAKNSLEIFSACDAKTSLSMLIDYVISREN